MDLGLRKRVCVVTGSTGGIGLETARLLVEEGARVVVTGRTRGRVDAMKAEVGAALGVVCDLADAEAPALLIERAIAEVGPVDVLVNNVGIAYQLPFDRDRVPLLRPGVRT